jgi:hypothetical protein
MATSTWLYDKAVDLEDMATKVDSMVASAPDDADAEPLLAVRGVLNYAVQELRSYARDSEHDGD